MAGIFDSGIFDSGIFDMAGGGGSPPPPPPVAPETGGGSKRYWDWIRGNKELAAHVRGEDVERIQRALRGPDPEKPKRAPTVLKMVAAIREAEPKIPYEAKSELAALGVFQAPETLDADAFAKTLKRDRAVIAAAYLAIQEAKAEAEAALTVDDEEVISLFLEHRRRIVMQAVALLKRVAS